MKKIYLLLIFTHLMTSFSALSKDLMDVSSENIEKSIEKQESTSDWKPTGTVGFTQTFFGNSGKYENAMADNTIELVYNFHPNWDLTLISDRFFNIYEGGYQKEPLQANNNYNYPKGELSYTHEDIGKSKIDFTLNLGVRQSNYFSPSTNQLFTWINTIFDFAKYFPKGEILTVNKFAIQPLFYYGFYPNETPGEMKNISLNFLTNYSIGDNLTLELDIFLMREFYKGDFAASFTNANYLSLFATFEYTRELYKFNEKSNLQFTLNGGIDTFSMANKKGYGWAPPFWLGDNCYESLLPTLLGDGKYKSIWTAFLLPQFQINYNFTENLSTFVGVGGKFNNQIWGGKSKDWKWQPLVAFGFNYSF